MKVHLVDGTYELFRHFYAVPSARDAGGREVGAVRGVIGSLLGMINRGATHVGVATDHVIESFRNRLWRGYKTGAGVDLDLLSQFPLLEEAVAALGVRVWPMIEFEADDALAAAAARAGQDARVEKVLICTPDKDLAQCVVGDRVVQVDRRSGQIRDEAAVMEKFGVPPRYIADYLALVGDSADGYPGIAGYGARTAARMIAAHGGIESFPPDALGAQMERALLFLELARLRTDAPLFENVDALRWRGVTKSFPKLAERFGDAGLVRRLDAVRDRVAAAGG